MDYVNANDTCIQCHSQGRPVHNPMEGKYYDWPVGYRVGLHLRDTQPRSEEHTSELQSLTNLVCRLLLEKKNSTGLIPRASSHFNKGGTTTESCSRRGRE